MRALLRQVVAAPVYTSVEQAEQAAMLLRVMRWTVIIVTVALSAVALAQPDVAARAFTNLSVILAVCGVAWVLCRSGQPMIASRVFIAGIITVIAVSSVTAGGIRSPGTGFFVVFVLMAGLLLGERAGLVTGIVCALIGLGLLIAEMTGVLPEARVRYAPPALWFLSSMYIGIVIALQRMAAGVVARSFARAERELAARELAVAQLNERVKELRLLHALARILQRDRPVDQSLLDEIVALMPAAWQYPDVCVARLTVGDLVAANPGWRDSPWCMQRTITTSAGTVDLRVTYLDRRANPDGDPFLPEEYALLDSIAEMLRAFIDRRHAFEQRRHAESELRQSQKMQALGTLAGGIAHDFNNLLTAIIANVDFGRHVTSDPAARESFDEIHAASQRAADLVKRILLFSRRQQPERTAVSLAAVVDEAARLLRMTHADVDIRLVVPPDVPPILADASQLHQIVMNLGTNAAYAMRERRKELTIAIEQLTIGDGDASPSVGLGLGDYVCLVVRDTGSGISDEVKERLFEPFFTTKGADGTGLGLSMVHGIMAEHDGAITVESTVGVGTTFRLYFPAVTSPTLGAAAGGVVPDAPSRGSHIIIVDDEEPILRIAARMLEQHGHRVTAFTDAHAALHAIRTTPHAVDAVVTDLAMPHLSGVEFIRLVRQARPDLPIAIATGWGDTAAARIADVPVIIAKPFSVQTLLDAVGQLLERRTH